VQGNSIAGKVTTDPGGHARSPFAWGMPNIDFVPDDSCGRRFRFVLKNKSGRARGECAIVLCLGPCQILEHAKYWGMPNTDFAPDDLSAAGSDSFSKNESGRQEVCVTSRSCRLTTRHKNQKICPRQIRRWRIIPILIPARRQVPVCPGSDGTVKKYEVWLL
jgi:hypothetical protein